MSWTTRMSYAIVVCASRRTNMKNIHRVFLAISLPGGMRERLYAFRDRWPELPARWTRTENLHVTLLFLGNVSDAELPDVCRVAHDVAKRHAPFALRFSRVRFGPEDKAPERVRPRMVWVVGERSSELDALRRDLEHELCGGPSGGAFTPHVTIARIKQTELRSMEQEEVPAVDEKIGEESMVESVEVMESDLKRGGPVYTVLESAKLGE